MLNPKGSLMERISTENIILSEKGGSASLWQSLSFPAINKDQFLDFSEHYGFAVFLGAVFFLPVCLVFTGVIPFHYRFHTSAAVLAAMGAFCVIRRYSLNDLGFRVENIGKSMALNGLFCLLGSMALLLLHSAGYERPHHPSIGVLTYLAYVFILAPVQEIFFRGLLFAEFDQWKIAEKKWPVLFLTSSIFAFLHVIYLYPPMIPITFVAGLAWGLDFQRHRNIWGVMVSHAVLGSLAMVLRII